MKRYLALLIFFIIFLSCERDRQQYPQFNFSFENDSELNFISWDCHSAFAISDSFAVHGEHSLRVTFFPRKEASLRFGHFDADWRAGDTLSLYVFNPGQDSINIELVISNYKSYVPHTHRFNKTLTVMPDHNRFLIPLKGIKTSGTKREIDLDNIRSVNLLLPEITEPTTLYFDHFHLR